MKKRFLYLLLALVVASQGSQAVLAQSPYMTSSVKVAIHKYKVGNYTGCLQSCQNIVSKDPSNALAHYYLAMAYVKAGKKDLAIKEYSKVIALKPNVRMINYAAMGQRCLETPDKCHPTPAAAAVQSDLDKFIASPSMTPLAPKVRQDYDKLQLDSIKNQINDGKSIDSYSLRRLNYNAPEEKTEKAAVEVSKTPTNEQIAAALKVLREAGLNPYSSGQLQANATTAVNPYAQADMTQNPEIAQLNMLMGGSGQNKNENGMMNMLPYMLAQNKNGTTNYSPQVVQSMIMNSMMSSMDFGTDNKDKQY